MTLAVSVVVPCLNEADNIDAVHAEIVADLADLADVAALDIVFVDDGSTDATLQRIRAIAAADPRVGYLSFTRNFGLEAAFSAGYRYARQEWILHLDADLQFPPAQARHLLAAAATGGYDAVFGVRSNRQDRLLRRAASRLHDLIARRLLKIEIPKGATTFRLVRADLARRIVDLDVGTPYFLATVPRLTAAWTTVPTAHRARRSGEPKVSVRGLAHHAMQLFVSFSDRPIAVAAGCLLLATLLCLGGAVAAAAGAVTAGIVVLAAACGLGFAAMAVSTRYLLHLAHRRKVLPQYLIRETNLPVDPRDLLPPPTLPPPTLPPPARGTLRVPAGGAGGGVER